MKKHIQFGGLFFVAMACLYLILASSCKKDNEDPAGDIFWNENWLIGTWEGTTPITGDPLFDNKKISIVFEEVMLKNVDTVPNNTVKEWAYSGIFTWDVDGTPWTMRFYHSSFPGGLVTIGWQSMSMLQANVTVNNISLRVGDTVSLDPNREMDFDLDWGPYNDYTRDVPTYLDFYGDIEIYQGGNYYEADYLDGNGTMIRLSKK